MHLKPVCSYVAYSRHRQAADCPTKSRYLRASRSKPCQRLSYGLAVVAVVPFVDRAIESLGNQSVDCIDRIRRRTSYSPVFCASFSSLRRNKNRALRRRGLLSLESLKSSRFVAASYIVAASYSLLHRLDIVEVPNVLGLACPLIRLIVQAEVRTIYVAQTTFRSMAITVVR